MIDQKTYDELEERYGQVASWALWEPGNIGEKIPVSSKEREVFKDPTLGSKLHTDFVIVSINPSQDNPLKNTYDGSWLMFHCGKFDHILRDAFKDTRISGSYMTNLYKECVGMKSDDVFEKAKKDPSLEERAVNELKKELEMIGGKPVLIALGIGVKDALDKHFSKDYRVEKITNHGYAGRNSGRDEKCWRKEVKDLIEELTKLGYIQ